MANLISAAVPERHASSTQVVEAPPAGPGTDMKPVDLANAPPDGQAEALSSVDRTTVLISLTIMTIIS